MQEAVNSPHWYAVVKDFVLIFGGLAGASSAFKVFWLDRRKQASDVLHTEIQTAGKRVETIGATIDRLEAAAVKIEALRAERDRAKDESKELKMELKRVRADLKMCKEFLPPELARKLKK